MYPLTTSHSSSPHIYHNHHIISLTEVFEASGNLPSSCSTSALTAKQDLNAKLSASGTTIQQICNAALDSAAVTPFYEAARQGTDYQFEQHYCNGRTTWEEDVETLYESADGTAGIKRMPSATSPIPLREISTYQCTYMANVRDG